MREKILLVDVQEVERRAEQALLRRSVAGKERALAEELLRGSEDREASRDRAIAKIRLRERELERALAITVSQIERGRLAATEKIVGRIIETEERAADAGDAAVERDLLATFLNNLEVDVNPSLLFVRAKVRIAVFINRIEEAKLVETQDRDFIKTLIVNVAFVDEHFAPEHVVARKRVAQKFQAAQRELLAFRDREHEVHDAFFRILWIVLEGRLDIVFILNEAL